MTAPLKKYATLVTNGAEFYRLKKAGAHVHIINGTGLRCANGGKCPAGERN